MEGLYGFFVWLIRLTEYACIVAFGGISFMLDVDVPEDSLHRSELQELVGWIKLHAMGLGLTTAVVLLVAKIGRAVNRQRTREALILDRLTTKALDTFRGRCFSGLPENVPSDHNRVTIFKHYKTQWWIWPFRGFITPWGFPRGPCSGWLAVFQRSGHVTQTGGAVFLAPDDAIATEGVAGAAWRSGAVRVGRAEHRLPDLSDIRPFSRITSTFYRCVRRFYVPRTSISFHKAESKVNLYADMTMCSSRFVWKRIRMRRNNPTSILGVRLNDRHNSPWGVLVMDSCNEYECIDTNSPQFRKALTELKNELRDLGVLD